MQKYKINTFFVSFLILNNKKIWLMHLQLKKYHIYVFDLAEKLDLLDLES